MTVTAPTSGPEPFLANEFFELTRSVLTAAGAPDYLLREGDDVHHPDDVWRALAETGAMDVLVPQTIGGLGLGLVELGAVFRAVGHRPCRVPLLDRAVTLPLAWRAAPAALRRHVEEFFASDRVVALAEALPPPYGLAAETVRCVDGTLDGHFPLVPFATSADTFVVVATAPSGPIVTLVDAESVTVSPLTSSDPCVEYGTVRVDRVPVSKDQVIVSDASAIAWLDELHGSLRLMAAAEVRGAVEAMAEQTLDYAKTRVQFGRPVGGFQAVRHILAEMYGRASGLSNLVDAALADAQNDPTRVAELGRIVKAHSSFVGRHIAEQSLQLHGGIGFTYELPLHLYFRRVLSLQGFLGETADLLVVLGRDLV